MFFFILSSPSSIKLHSGQGSSLSFLWLFYVSVPHQLAPSQYTIKHLLKKPVNLSRFGRCRNWGLETLNNLLSVRQLGTGLKLKSTWLQNCSTLPPRAGWLGKFLGRARWEDFHRFLPLSISLEHQENFDHHPHLPHKELLVLSPLSVLMYSNYRTRPSADRLWRNWFHSPKYELSHPYNTLFTQQDLILSVLYRIICLILTSWYYWIWYWSHSMSSL